MAGIDAEQLSAFAEDVAYADWQGTKYEIGEHQREWFDLWCKHNLLLILASRGHGKTETVVVLPILYLSVMEQDILIYIVSVSQEQSVKILARIKRIIERQFPWLVDRRSWAKQEIRTTGRVTIVAKGFLTSIIGPHPQYIFVDDPIEDQQSYSDSSIESWFFADLFPMLAKGGKLLVVGTYKHFNDLFHTIQARGLFRTEIYPAIVDGKLLWPSYWTQELLDERKQALGSLLFSREYMLQPIDDTSSLFPRSQMSECFDASQHLIKSYEGEQFEVYVGVDVATSEKVGADYSVFTILGYDKEEDDILLFDIQAYKGLGLHEHVDILSQIDEAYNPVHVKIEKNAFQTWLKDEASSVLRECPITGHTTGKEKSDMREGVPSLSLLFERRRIRIPRGRTDDEIDRDIALHECEAVQKTETLVHQLNSIGFESGKVKSVAKHDDYVMSLWFAILAIREGKKKRGLAMTTVDSGIYGARSTRKGRASKIARRRAF